MTVVQIHGSFFPLVSWVARIPCLFQTPTLKETPTHPGEGSARSGWVPRSRGFGHLMAARSAAHHRRGPCSLRARGHRPGHNVFFFKYEQNDYSGFIFFLFNNDTTKKYLESQIPFSILPLIFFFHRGFFCFLRIFSLPNIFVFVRPHSRLWMLRKCLGNHSMRFFPLGGSCHPRVVVYGGGP